MSDFAPGDVVVCVDAGDLGVGSRNVGLLSEGRLYRVARVTPPYPWSSGDFCYGVVVEGVRSYNFDGSFHPRRFRKIRPASDQFTRQIRACKPIKEKEPA